MSLILTCLCTSLLTIPLSPCPVGPPSTDDPPTTRHLELKALDGRSLDERSAEWRVICFLGTECPVARAYARPLESLCQRYAPRSVQFVGVFSNLHDSPADVDRFAKEMGLTFPLVHDSTQSIAKRLQVSRVPEILVMDQQGEVRYQGRIDDQFAPGVKRSEASEPYLEEALKALLSGQSPKHSKTNPVGCLITFAKIEADSPSSQVTYTRDIAPIFHRHCVECHRPGEIGPFDMSDFQEIRGWADMIVEVIEQKRMPPWHADPSHGHFKNQRSMNPSDLQLLKQWVEAGTPFGNPADLPPFPKFVEGWRLNQVPELIVPMRDKAYTIPANGSVDYQYFVVDPQLTEDRWVSAAEIVPGNPAVVHHAIVFVRPPDGIEIQGIGWLTAYVPGQRATNFPSGFARKIPAGSKFVFQMHYTPNGSEQQDCSRIGLTFIEEAQVTHEIFTMIGINQQFEIPPHAPQHVVDSHINHFPNDGLLLTISPHMHLRGKSFELTSVQKAPSSHQDLDREVLLRVPQYDFNWQHTYEFAEPIPFRKLHSLELKAVFDNSKENPFNPNPNEYVVWGDQTWEEMSVAFLEVARPLQSKETPPAPNMMTKPSTPSSTDDSSREVEFADAFLEKFDRNRDGKVLRDETSRVVQMYSFRRLDINNDGHITRDELLEATRAHRVK